MRWSVPLVVSLLLILAVSARADEAPPAGDGLIDRALAAFEKGEYETVIELTAQVAEDAEERPRARYLAGEAHLLLRQPEPAEKAFREVLVSRPKAVPAWVGLGRALDALKKTEEAEEVLTKAVKLDPKSAAAKRALGELLMHQGELGKARTLLKAAYKLDPDDALSARALVEVLLLGSDAGGAERVAKKLEKARPNHPMGYFLHGLVRERKGKIEDAIDYYETALGFDERFLDAHKNLAILYHTNNPDYADLDRVRKALHHYEEYFGLGGKDPALRDVWRRFQRFVILELDLEDEEDDDEEEEEEDEE